MDSKSVSVAREVKKNYLFFHTTVAFAALDNLFFVLRCRFSVSFFLAWWGKMDLTKLFGPMLRFYANPKAAMIGSLSRSLQVQFEYAFWQLGSNFERALFLLVYQAQYTDNNNSQRVVRSDEFNRRNTQIFTSFVVETFKALSPAYSTSGGGSLAEEKLPSAITYTGGPLEGAYLNADEVDSAISYLILLLVTNLFSSATDGLFGSLVCSGIVHAKANEFMNICYDLIERSSGLSSAGVQFVARFNDRRRSAVENPSALSWEYKATASDVMLESLYPYEFYIESTEALTLKRLYKELSAQMQSSTSRQQLPLQAALLKYDVVYTQHFRIAHQRARLNGVIEKWLRQACNPHEPEEFEMAVEHADCESKLREFSAEVDHKVDPSSTGNISPAERIAIMQAINNLMSNFRGNYTGKAKFVQYLTRQLGASVREPTSNHILVVGEPGTGKTSMISEVASIMMLCRLILPPTFSLTMDLAQTVYTLMDTESRETYTNIARSMGFLPKKDFDDTSADKDGGGDDDDDKPIAPSKGKAKKGVSVRETGAALSKLPFLSSLSGSRAIELRQALIVLASLPQTSVPVIIEPSNLIGQYQGQTNYHTVRAIFLTLGACLIVDEAYQLLSQQQEMGATLGQFNTYITKLGKHWASALVGYPDEIIQTVRVANPGLESRYATTILFPSFKPRELSAILGDRVNSSDSLPQFYYGMRVADFMALADEDLDTHVVVYMSQINNVMLRYGSRQLSRLPRNVFGGSNARSLRNMATKSYSQLTYGGLTQTDTSVEVGRLYLVPPSRFSETIVAAHKAAAPFDRFKRRFDAASVQRAAGGGLATSDETDEQMYRRLQFKPEVANEVLRENKKRELDAFLLQANVTSRQQLLEVKLFESCKNFTDKSELAAVIIALAIHALVTSCYPDVLRYYATLYTEPGSAESHVRRAETVVFDRLVLSMCKQLEALLSDPDVAPGVRSTRPHFVADFLVFGIPYQIGSVILEQRLVELEFDSKLLQVNSYKPLGTAAAAVQSGTKRRATELLMPGSAEPAPAVFPLLVDTPPVTPVPESSLFSSIPSAPVQPTLSVAVPPSTAPPSQLEEYNADDDFKG